MSGSKIEPQQASVDLGDSITHSLDGRSFSSHFVEVVPIDFARKFNMIGFAETDGVMDVAFASDDSLIGLENLKRFLDVRIAPFIAPEDQIRKAINSAYEQRTGQTQAVLDSLDVDVMAEVAALSPREDLLSGKDRAPVIRLVNSVLFEAVTGLASDIHVQPYESDVVIRIRVDGVLHDAHRIPKHLQEEVITRIKVVGGMNIAEKRLPQDGRASVEVGDRVIDLRIASMPTSHGERVVIRLLDKSARLYELAELGMEGHVTRQWRQMIGMEHGLILVTGPTGSGKSTTLYASLGEINTNDRNVLTLEDPIEYQLDGISQTQINVKKGMTFASGLRSMLRQDPDILMVGEIRDHETAVMAIQAALTGHLVFSTLHTNDAASAVTRLLDLGIEPYLVASSLRGVLAQRLVRRTCPDCATPDAPDFDMLQLFGWDSAPPAADFQRGAGCVSCRHTGYRGRFTISELLVPNESIRRLIQDRANASEVLDAARAGGMAVMSEDGARKARLGQTTLAEVSRVTINAVV